MPQIQIIDLDAALPPDKQVRIGGEVHTLPGDIPVELFLRIQRAAAELEAATTAGDVTASIGDLHEAILTLFRERDATITHLPLGTGQMASLLMRVYLAAEVPPTTPTSGATKPSRKPPARSRS